MRKLLSLALTAALLLGLGACFGSGGDKPTTAPDTTPSPAATTTEADTTIAAATVASGENSEQLIAEIFMPAIEMYSILSHGAVEYDFASRFERDGWEYAPVIDPRFTSIAVLEAAARKIFSDELVREYMSLTAESRLSEGADEDRIEIARQLPLFTEKDGKLYALVDGRGTKLSLESIRIESQSESKIVYTLRAVSHWEDEPFVEKEYSYTRELIGGKWVFTVFPMDWY